MRFLGALAVVLLLVGCTTQDAGEPLDQTWQRVDLPVGFVASQLVVVDGQLVVGGSADDASTDREVPALVTGADTGEPEFVPLTSTTFYGAVARWYSLVVDGSQLRALGGRTGGGHGNPRWSTWVGDLEHFDETHTPGIETFGGPRGGGMVGIAVVDGQPVIAGGRVGEQAGLDIAVWLEQDDTWIEQPSSGTALEASDTVLPFPSSVVAAGDRLLITGFTQVLGGGEVHSRAAAWIGDPLAADPTTSWRRIDLPADSPDTDSPEPDSSDAGTSEAETADATALSALCTATRCVIAGSSDGALVAWSISDDEAATLPVPTIEVGDADVPAPVAWGDHITVVAAQNGACVIAVATSDDLSAWELRAGPAGTPIAAAASGDLLYVVVTTADGSVELWSTAAGS